jgi:hypothetical protein
MKDRRKGMDTLRARSPYIPKKCTPHIVALWAPLTAMHDPKFDMVTVLGILPVVQRREPSLVRKVTRKLNGRETRKKLPHWHAALGHWRTKCSYRICRICPVQCIGGASSCLLINCPPERVVPGDGCATGVVRAGC